MNTYQRALRQLLHDLAAVADDAEELCDTACQQKLSEAVWSGFVRRDGRDLPVTFGLATPEANKRVGKALAAFLAKVVPAAAKDKLSFRDRLAHLQDRDVTIEHADLKLTYRDFFEHRDAANYDASGRAVAADAAALVPLPIAAIPTDSSDSSDDVTASSSSASASGDVRDPSRRVAIVTGGTRGIGEAIVRGLLEAGWNVAFCSRREDAVANLHGALAARYGDARVLSNAVNVRDSRLVTTFINEVADQFGRIDCLVNNAGVGRIAKVDELSDDDWRAQIETNLSGAFYAIRAVAPVMRAAGGGTIVNMASVAGRQVFAGGSGYNASKFGLLGLSEAAMFDLRHDNIRVTAVLPGSVQTQFLADATGKSSDSDDDTANAWMLQAEDVARVVIELLDWPQHVLPVQIEVRPLQPPRR
ncbi:MAG: SDR family NAD(P)-dependent oxidoreductase [Planctomycetota bacterium]